MPNVAFKKGLLANLPATKTAGCFYVTTDERAIYLDIDSSNRIRIGDFQEFATVAALEANTNPSTTALYYVTAINCLAKWDGSKYVQINLDTGATSIEVVGSGNAVTAASYDATTRKLTLTKGVTFAVPNDITIAIDALDLPNTYEAKGAAATVKSEVIGASGDAASADTIYGAKAYADAAANGKDAAIAAAKKAGDDAQSDVDALEGLVGTLPAGATATTVTGYIDEAADAAEAAAKAVANAKVASVSAAENKGIEIGGTATDPTVGVKLSAKPNNDLSFATGSGEDGGLYYHAPAAAEYTIEKLATAETGYAASYKLTKDGVQAGATINIPKDMVVESGTVETKTEPGAWGPAGTYLHLVLANTTEDDIYINVSDLIEYVTSGSQTGDMVVINIDSNHKVTATITDGTITLAKLATAVQTEIGKAHTHSNKALLDTYTQTETDLADAVAKKHEHSNKAVLDGIAASDVAAWNGEIGSAAAIAAIKDGASIDSFGDVETALAGKQDTIPANTYDAYGAAATAKSEVIGASGDAATANTVYGAKAYADAAVAAGLTWGSF